MGIAGLVRFRFLTSANRKTAYAAAVGDIMTVAMVHVTVFVSYIVAINGLAAKPADWCGTLFTGTKAVPFALKQAPEQQQ